MIQWAIELSQFDIEYQPRMAIKAQVLLDFIAEFTSPDTWRQPGRNLDDPYGRIIHIEERQSRRRHHFPWGGYFEVWSLTQIPHNQQRSKVRGYTDGVRIAQALGVKNVLLRSDSQLIVGQVKRDFEAKETSMQKYLKLMNQLVSNF